VDGRTKRTASFLTGGGARGGAMLPRLVTETTPPAAAAAAALFVLGAAAGGDETTVIRAKSALSVTVKGDVVVASPDSRLLDATQVDRDGLQLLRHFHCAVACVQDPYSVFTPMKMVVPSDLVVSSESETSPSFVWKTLALTLVVAFSIGTNRTAGIRRSRSRWGRIDGQADEGCPSGSLRKRRPRQAHRRDVPRLRWRSPGRAR
jgi:hypothetical protein